MKLKEFTDEGNQKFILLYQKIKASVQQKKGIEKGYTSNFKKQMEDLVHDNNLSNELSASNSKDLKFQEFENQFVFGKYIFELLENHNETTINNNDKLWNWLSAFFFNIVFHKKARKEQLSLLMVMMQSKHQFYLNTLLPQLLKQ